MRAALCGVLILAAWPALAAPERSPRPQVRPDIAEAPGLRRPELRYGSAVQPPVVAAPSGALLRSPRPLPRPSVPVTMPAAIAPAPAPVPGGGICGVEGLSGKHLAPIAPETSGCGIADPVEVTAVQGLKLSLPLTMDCAAGRALNDWVRTVLKPTFEGRIRRIEVAGAYACRGRNNVKGAQISEHGRGRAVDISGLGFTDGTGITVARDWNRGRDGKLMTRAYHAGCGIFGTTLGPGSDGYHEDHMHFDVPVKPRRSPYCR